MKCQQRSSDDKLKMCEVVMVGKRNCEKTEEGLYTSSIYAYPQRESCAAYRWSFHGRTTKNRVPAPLFKGDEQGLLMKGASG